MTRQKSETDAAPKPEEAVERIVYALRSTRLGWMLVAFTDRGICCVQFADDEGVLLDALKSEFPHAHLAAAPTSAHDSWVTLLDQYIGGVASKPDLPLDIRGSEFQRQVWQGLQRIPEGQVLSYRALAERLGRPSAVRAVATACARNRIAVLIPCHRVVRQDGGLGGYRWGLERKRAILAAEQLR
ncbi:methylated-DNA--[protein]-cysteine S-methyltransferase [Marinobacter sp. VGCF2001]|uniref:methylated-DNA--[protein]-cysteine S-methyltransferase n=1 Tax=Marinobacter sp. VGCF2001 TaxID=3417189 RepID=UPI003CED3A19